MSSITPQQFEAILPLAAAWAEEQESIIIRRGYSLTDAQLVDARQIGVKYPERVRLLGVEQIPIPNNPMLAKAATETNLISTSTTGMTFRYGIYIRTDCWKQRLLVAHELVHTLQFERLGGFEAFLRPYLEECLTLPGYPHGPMEQEAVTTSERICRPIHK